VLYMPMAKSYDHQDIDKKWQARWREDGTYRTETDSSKEKAYVLDMFPYPSGDGLHVGHPKGYIATDVYSRYQRMRGKSVLHPMGWDAFGLPAENYALKNKVHPRVAVEKNITYFKQQLEKIGFDYDWSKEINTTDPEYYRWTQWIFLKLYENGLAYRSEEPINWCPSCMTGLANEDIEQGVCERCSTAVVKKILPQWVLKITDYADRLLEDLEQLPKWPEHIKESQRNWIGRSEGAEIDFKVGDRTVRVFTTRPDTLFGATYLVLAPEHPLVQEFAEESLNSKKIHTYVEAAANKSEIERTADGKEKSGVLLEGISGVNPANGETISVWVADYVLGYYGTGAVMAVPAHDARDLEFAQKYDLPVRQVVVPCAPDPQNPPQEGFSEVKRDTVVVHLRDRSTGKFALLDWHGTLEGITTAIMGGIEEGQTPEEAALMEIQEEAGLENVTIVKKSPWITAARYCASHKKENRCAHSFVLLAEVESLSDMREVDSAEKAKHTLVWVDENQVLPRLTPVHQKQMWNLLEKDTALEEAGYLINSDTFNGRDSEEVKWDIAKSVGGKRITKYRLRDWVFSRQRYWGEPIPILYCETCGTVPVPYEDLPVKLPEVEHYEPTGTGESPLAAIEEWVNTTCPKCKGPAKRETNTMPQWAGSSWYYLRYMDPDNSGALVDPKNEKYWSPVDLYVGGAEHATRHLIYARFWHKFLYDIKAVSTLEPFTELHSVGLIIAEDGKKMSKRFGNVVNPDEVVAEYGADAFRVYEMFMGPFENSIAWNTKSLIGSRRFLERVFRMAKKVVPQNVPELNRPIHLAVQKVTNHIPEFRFNTAVSAMMICLNAIEDVGSVGKEQWSLLLQVLAPFAPHIAEELWEEIGNKDSIHLSEWPIADASFLTLDTVVIGVQVAGKLRGEIEIASAASEKEAVSAALAIPKVLEALGGSKPGRVVYRAGRILNLLP